jgi:hypothetical protein
LAASFFISEIATQLQLPRGYNPTTEGRVQGGCATDALRNYGNDWPAFKSRHAVKLAGSVSLGNELVADLNANKVLARTYLTYGWRHKHRAVRNRIPNPVLQVVRTLELPRFVYVTEFARVDGITNKPIYERRIIAQCVIDATAKN